MVDWIDSDGFRANVGIVLMRGDGQLFLGGRTGGRGWQFPQGGVRPGEPLLDALYRELHEEVGLEPADVDVLAQTRDWLRYRLPPRYVRRASLPLCVGQKQRWFLLRFTGNESRLRFDATGEPPEFDRWRWVEYWDPIKEVVYFKRQVYRRALHELGRRVYPSGLPAYPAWWQADAEAVTGKGGRSRGSRPQRAPASAPR